VPTVAIYHGTENPLELGMLLFNACIRGQNECYSGGSLRLRYHGQPPCHRPTQLGVYFTTPARRCHASAEPGVDSADDAGVVGTKSGVLVYTAAQPLRPLRNAPGTVSREEAREGSALKIRDVYGPLYLYR